MMWASSQEQLSLEEIVSRKINYHKQRQEKGNRSETVFLVSVVWLLFLFTCQLETPGEGRTCP
jgi:hypothetical protein